MIENLGIAQFQPHIKALESGYGHTTQQAEAVIQSGLLFINQLPSIQYSRGAFLCQEELPVETIHVLRRGHVIIFRFDDSGNRRISEIASPMTIIGGGILHGSEEHDYYATVFTDVCEAQPMSTGDLSKGFKNNPQVELFFHVDHAVQLAKWNRHFWEWGMKSVPARLAGALLYVLELQDTLPFHYFPQSTLAELAGTTRESTVVVLRALRREGVLFWRQSQSPELLDEDALEQIYREELKLRYLPKAEL